MKKPIKNNIRKKYKKQKERDARQKRIFIPTKKKLVKQAIDNGNFVEWATQLGWIRMEIEIIEDLMYTAVKVWLPNLFGDDFPEFPYERTDKNTTFGEIVTYLYKHCKDMDENFKANVIGQYKAYRNEFSHLGIGKSKRMVDMDYDDRIAYRNRFHKLHYELHQMLGALYIVFQINNGVRELSKCPGQDKVEVVKDYLPKVYNTFDLPDKIFNRKRRKAIQAIAEKNAKGWEKGHG
jgi:hypothetical protein